MVLTHKQFTLEKTIEGVPCKGTVDAVFNGHVVEAKHTNPFYKMSDVINRYMPQLQMYCYLSGKDGIWLSVIFGNSDYKYVFIDFDLKYFSTMMKHVKNSGNMLNKMNNQELMMKYQKKIVMLKVYLLIN